MSRNQELDSASTMVEEIFADSISSQQKGRYEERLRTNYLHKKNERKIPERFRFRFGSGVRKRSHLSLEERTYFANLLLLDTLFGKPAKVFDLLTRKETESEAEWGVRVCDQIRVRRAELEPLLEHMQAMLADSERWEELPTEFDLHRTLLSGLLKDSSKSSGRMQGESWKFPLVEEIRRLEDSDEWRAGEADAVAEVAMLYSKLGLQESACRHIEEAFVEHPGDSGLWFAKATLIMRGSAHHFEQMQQHEELGAGGQIPITAEEQWRDELAAEAAGSLLCSEHKALIALINCYLHLGEYPPRWALALGLHDVRQWLIEAVIKRSAGFARLYAEARDVMPSALSNSIELAVARIKEDSDFVWRFFRSDGFGLLLLFWEVSRRFDWDAYQELVARWFGEVSSLAESRKEIKARVCCPFETSDLLFRKSWSDGWPSVIVESLDNPEMHRALSVCSNEAGFRSSILAKQEWQVSDQRLWKAIQFEWRRLLDRETNTPQKAIQVCEDACSLLPWADSVFSNRWLLRWRYAKARCHFDAAMLLVGGGDKQGAVVHLEQIDQMVRAYSGLKEIDSTHMTILNDTGIDPDPSEDLCDLTGSYANIFGNVDFAYDDLGPRAIWPAGPSVLFDAILVNRCREFPLDEKLLDCYSEMLKKLESFEGSPFERLSTLLRS